MFSVYVEMLCIFETLVVFKVTAAWKTPEDRNEGFYMNIFSACFSLIMLQVKQAQIIFREIFMIGFVVCF